MPLGGGSTARRGRRGDGVRPLPHVCAAVRSPGGGPGHDPAADDLGDSRTVPQHHLPAKPDDGGTSHHERSSPIDHDGPEGLGLTADHGPEGRPEHHSSQDGDDGRPGPKADHHRSGSISHRCVTAAVDDVAHPSPRAGRKLEQFEHRQRGGPGHCRLVGRGHGVVAVDHPLRAGHPTGGPAFRLTGRPVRRLRPR